MSYIYPPNRYQHFVWKDLPGCTAILEPLVPSIDQASVQLAGKERATLLLFREALVGMVELQFSETPDDATLLVVGRTVVAHQRACCEGGANL